MSIFYKNAEKTFKARKLTQDMIMSLFNSNYGQLGHT